MQGDIFIGDGRHLVMQLVKLCLREPRWSHSV